MSKRPTVFRLDDPDVVLDGFEEPKPAPKKPQRRTRAKKDDKATIEPDLTLDEALSPDETGTAIEEVSPAHKRGFPWAKAFGTALGGLVSIALGLWVTETVEALFLRAEWLGWLGLGLAVLAGVALAAFVLRELFGILRLTRITSLREEANAAATDDDAKAAQRIVGRLSALYADDATTAKGRNELADHAGDIIDGRDRLMLAERHLLTPKDAAARALILSAAKRVTAVTALSPRAFVDILYVFYEALRLIRRLATLYGGRPGGFGTAKLARMVIGHLALTGGVAATDAVVQQLVGHGLAARLSARFGEGVVNGLMTARIGLAALDVCRPLPHLARKPPAISDILSELTKFGGGKKEEG